MINDILITHLHFDHWGDIPYLYPRPDGHVGFDPRAADRDHPSLDQALGHTQRHHLDKHASDRVLLTATEPSERGMVRRLVRHHP